MYQSAALLRLAGFGVRAALNSADNLAGENY